MLKSLRISSRVSIRSSRGSALGRATGCATQVPHVSSLLRHTLPAAPSLSFSQLRHSHYAAPHSSDPSEFSSRKKVTISDLQKLKKLGKPITMITAHDYISGLLADQAGVDAVLVGDSMAMVALGYESTNEVSFDEMLYVSRAVSRGVQKAFQITDLPFGSYETSPEKAMESAVAMVKKGRAEAVKIEGGKELVPTIEKLTKFGVPVVGHIGLTPQRQSSLGGFRVQGKTAKSAEAVLEDALAIQEAGCCLIVLEAVPDKMAELISSQLTVPTIGIGAGPHTDGQVLVQLDMLGGFSGFTPKFLKKYSNMLESHTTAIRKYCEEVRSKQFPSEEYCYVTKEEEVEKFRKLLQQRGSKNDGD